MRNVALAAVIGVLVAAESLVGAPVAKADIDFECRPGCRGAIAASPSTGEEVIRLNYRTRKRRRTQPSCGATSMAQRCVEPQRGLRPHDVRNSDGNNVKAG